MKRRIEEWVSLRLAKNPRHVVLFSIILFNVLFLLLSAVIISNLSLSGTEKMGFFEAAFYTVTMILDAGCISFVVADIGQSGVAIAISCLIIIIIGMVTFTGAVIGYITNYISSFIEKSSSGFRKLLLSGHIVILNWNTRGSEIINDLLYCGSKEKVVVLINGRRSAIQKEIDERLMDTIHRENHAVWEKYRDLGFPKRHIRYFRERLKNNVTVILREGDVFSSKQLHDISLERAKSIIILGNEQRRTALNSGSMGTTAKGNAQTIKTLMQVSDITAAEYSADNQQIIVEITDDWTGELVDRIISYKQVEGKCNIVPVRVYRILGQLLSQFSIMPELNLAYTELFSNKGVSFFADAAPEADDVTYIGEYLKTHRCSVPLAGFRDERGIKHFFYAAARQKDVLCRTDAMQSEYSVRLNKEYWIEKKTVVILGHNSNCHEIMQGFEAFRNEWNYRDGSGEILNITVIDDQHSLEMHDFYRDYPFVVKTVAASVYEKDIICSTIEDIVDANDEDTSVLILSDDTAQSDDIDANALANLIYVQGIINKKKRSDPDFDTGRIDIVVEIIDPKHQDIVSSYSVDNIVISNRYISKMITQIGEKEAIFDFFGDILTYDAPNAERYVSTEVYAKKVSAFFDETPENCSAAELIRAVWYASADSSISPEEQHPSIVMGYSKPGGKIVLFNGNQDEISVQLEEHDKIIVFTNH